MPVIVSVLRVIRRIDQMDAPLPSRPLSILVAAIVAVVFGMLTLFSGGSVLFVDGPARIAAGNYVPFIVWFNFFAGLAYVLAGIGLYLWQGWAVKLSKFIFIATLLAFIGLGVHILLDGMFEIRTVGAMTLRSTVWLVIALISRVAWKNLNEQKKVEPQ